MDNYFVEMEGIVIKMLVNSTFRVQLDDRSYILCNTSRQIRKSYTPVSVGDRVKVASRSRESTQGCITECLLGRRKMPQSSVEVSEFNFHA